MVSSVARPVSIDFHLPLRTELVAPERESEAVPETAVHEHSDPLPSKHEIWPARQVRHMLLKPEPSCSKLLPNSQFWACILRPDSTHHLASDSRSQKVAQMTARHLCSAPSPSAMAGGFHFSRRIDANSGAWVEVEFIGVANRDATTARITGGATAFPRSLILSLRVQFFGHW